MREREEMLTWGTVATARVGDGEFILARNGEDWVVRVDERILMSNRGHQSEISLAEVGIARHGNPQSVLIGGLGLGYTLRAALDLLPPTAHVTVGELVGDLVEWNRQLIGHLNNHPCADPRCEIVVGDAYELIARSKRTFDVILLDVDNGPQALSQVKNQRLYGDIGTRACMNALNPEGVLVVWSSNPNAKYAARLARFGFETEVLRVPVSKGAHGTYVLFVGKKPKA